jgi:hypothetical protein
VATALQITPATANIAVGNTVSLVVLELFSDTSTGPLTGRVTWAAGTCAPASSVTIAASGTNGTEIASGQQVTTAACTITATEDTLTGTSAISVIPGTATLAYLSDGNPQQEISQYSVSQHQQRRSHH